jgi:hypothetical protein
MADEETEWPVFRLNSQHTAARGLALTDEPVLRWSFDTGGTVESSPGVVNGAVYVGTFNLNLVGGLLRASPAVVGDTVYFGADDNRFYAVNAQTGTERWSFKLGPGGEQSSPMPWMLRLARRYGASRRAMEFYRRRQWVKARSSSVPSMEIFMRWMLGRARNCGALGPVGQFSHHRRYRIVWFSSVLTMVSSMH